MALSDAAIRRIKWTGSAAGDKYADGEGMYLLVNKSGRYWRMDYRFHGKRRTLAIGIYPAVGLKLARERRAKAKEQLAEGLDPSQAKRDAIVAEKAKAANTFQAVAMAFHAARRGDWSQKYADRWLSTTKTYLFPAIGNRPIDSITVRQLRDVLRVVERRGIIETAHTLRQNAGQVFRYAIIEEYCERDITADLRGALKPIITRNMPAILEPVAVGALMRAIDGYPGQPTTRVAMALSALVFQRPGNIRQLEWAWIDTERAMLTIPSMAMKRRIEQKLNGRDHLVPLARQAVELIEEIRPLTGAGRYVFPSLRSPNRPMSDMTINAALRRLGFSSDEMTAHGFRAMARTLMVEQLRGIDSEVIEAQLAHEKSGPLGAAYDRAEFMDQRKEMMQRWADYLDELRAGAKVIPLRA